MKRYYYRSAKQSFGRRFSFGFLKLLLVVLAPIIFIGGIVWFRAQGKNDAPPVQKVQSAVVNIVDESGNTAPAQRDREEAQLTDVGGGNSYAVASRQVEDHVFRHTIVAHLPPLVDGQAYEGWLLIDDPFKFFSTGNFQPNADGTYGLVWEGTVGKDYEAYSKIIVTLEPTDGDPAPAVHVLEGTF